MKEIRKTLENIFSQYQGKIKMYYVQEKQELFGLDNFILIFISNTYLVEWKYSNQKEETEGCILICKDKDKFGFIFYPEWDVPEQYRWKYFGFDEQDEIIKLTKLIANKNYLELSKITDKDLYYTHLDIMIGFTRDWRKMVIEVQKKYEPILIQ